jgi:hypothetical protein
MAAVPMVSAQAGIENSFDLQTCRTEALEHVSTQEGIPAGKKVRVVAVWDSHPPDSHPPYDPVNDPLQSDFDLVVYDPNGEQVEVSSSYDNNYEIGQFTAEISGNYQARVVKYRFEGASERLALAYSISDP